MARKFVCPDCGESQLGLAYDATLTYQVGNILKDDVILSNTADVDTDYTYFFTFCRHCGTEIYDGKYIDSLIKALEEAGALREVDNVNV